MKNNYQFELECNFFFRFSKDEFEFDYIIAIKK